MERVGDVKTKREELETTLLASVPKWRSDLLTSVSVQTAPPLQQVYNMIILCIYIIYNLHRACHTSQHINRPKLQVRTLLYFVSIFLCILILLVVSNQHELELKIATLESENSALQRRLKEVTNGSTVDTKR